MRYTPRKPLPDNNYQLSAQSCQRVSQIRQWVNGPEDAFKRKHLCVEDDVRAQTSGFETQIKNTKNPQSNMENIETQMQVAQMENNSAGLIFTTREHQMMELITRGLSSKRIAAELFISEDTVESHRKNILKKLRVSNMIEAVAYAFRNNLIK